MNSQFSFPCHSEFVEESSPVRGRPFDKLRVTKLLLALSFRACRGIFPSPGTTLRQAQGDIDLLPELLFPSSHDVDDFAAARAIQFLAIPNGEDKLILLNRTRGF